MSASDARFADIPSTVGELIERGAFRFGDQEALVVGGERLTYAQLDREATRVAIGLLQLGVEAGDRVALLAANVMESYLLLFGVARMGGVFVPLNPRMTPRELEHALIRSGASTLVFMPHDGRFDYVDRLRSIEPEFGRSSKFTTLLDLKYVVTVGEPFDGATTFADLGRAESSAPDHPSVEYDDPVILQFTSGTTASPKGALVAHGPTVRLGYLCGANFKLSAADRYFVCNPICHMGGTTFSLIAAMSHGATFVTLPNFDPRAALDVMEAERCTVQHGIDSHYILEMEADPDPAARVALRLCSVVGGDEAMTQIKNAFRPDVVLSAYGSTETGGAPVCGAVDDPPDKQMLGAGRALPGVELDIVDPATGENLPRGAAGEVRIGGWSLMIGYYGQPEETRAQRDAQGRACTGDLAAVDADGFLTFLGRIKNVLRTGGENVSPEEVEAVLEGSPKVARAVVVGVPDQRLGEVGVAFVSPFAGAALDEEELRAHCLEELARFKIPRHFQFVEGLPMTESGKVDRARVRELASELDLQPNGAS
jgi:fatty-acyl-CoA synthase